MRRRIAGCFYCLKVFKLESVKKFTADGEMLCPFCGVDAVLDGVSCGAVLKRQNQKKFGTATNDRGETYRTVNGKLVKQFPKTQYGDK